jgi:hypothetical protein
MSPLDVDVVRRKLAREGEPVGRILLDQLLHDRPAV